MTDRMKEMVKEIVYSDFADEIIIYRLESVVEDCFDYMNKIGNMTNNQHLFEDYHDNLMMARACVQVLQWFSIKDYHETTVKVNQYSLKFEEMF
jgi:hypothetical protein